MHNHTDSPYVQTPTHRLCGTHINDPRNLELRIHARQMASDTYKAHIKRVPSKAGVKTVPLASIVVARGMAEGRGSAFILPSLTHCTMYIPHSTAATTLGTHQAL